MLLVVLHRLFFLDFLVNWWWLACRAAALVAEYFFWVLLLFSAANGSFWVGFGNRGYRPYFVTFCLNS
jgi:hypothetical protein